MTGYLIIQDATNHIDAKHADAVLVAKEQRRSSTISHMRSIVSKVSLLEVNGCQSKEAYSGSFQIVSHGELRCPRAT